MTARRYPLTRAATPDTIRGDDWRDQAACLGHEGVFDVAADHPNDGHAIAAALAICLDCPVADICRDANLREEFGVIGGTTPDERKHLRNKRTTNRRQITHPPEVCPTCNRVFRGLTAVANHYRQTHWAETGTCIRGHEWSGVGRCAPCKRDVEAGYRERRRETARRAAEQALKDAS